MKTMIHKYKGRADNDSQEAQRKDYNNDTQETQGKG